MDFQKDIKKTFYNKPFNKEAVFNHFRDLGYSEVTNEDRAGYHRFLFMQSGKTKTLFMKANNKGIVKYIKIQVGRHHIPKTESKILGNLIKLIFISMVIGFGCWCISYLDSDSPGNDDNPYNQDFDGDGIRGTKKDHEIYHKYYK